MGFTTTTLAGRIGTGAPTVSKAENGLRTLSEVKLIQYLTFCGLQANEIGPYLDLARRPDDGYHLSAFNGRMGDELIALVVHETTAQTIQEYECAVIPGLLQAHDYTDALIREAGLVPADEIETKVQRRINRQSILRQVNPPRSTFFIYEGVLRSIVGGSKIMNDQMMHLQFVSEWPGCSIRVVPMADYSRPGVTGAFRLMTFAEHGPVAMQSLMTAMVFAEKADDIALYGDALKRIDRFALNEGRSTALIASLADEYSRMGAGQHERGGDVDHVAKE